MKKYQLVEVGEGEPTIPACILQRVKDKDAYRKSYHSIHATTDPIKDEALSRLNTKLMPKEDSINEAGWEARQAYNLGYIKAMKEMIDMLP